MSGLAIAFPAEAAALIARTVIEAASNSFWPWVAAAAGLALLLMAPLRAVFGRAWTCLMKAY